MGALSKALPQVRPPPETESKRMKKSKRLKGRSPPKPGPPPWLRHLLLLDTPTGRMQRPGAELWSKQMRIRNKELKGWAAMRPNATLLPFDVLSTARGAPLGQLHMDW